MSLAKLASGARKHQHCRPVLLDTLWQQYLPRQSLLCTSSYTNKQQLRNFGFGSHMNDNDPEDTDREKWKNLLGLTRSVIPDSPGWNQQLASDSEAAVRADRSCIKDVRVMQLLTVEALYEDDARRREAEEIRIVILEAPKTEL